jgi:hypothetical protein
MSGQGQGQGQGRGHHQQVGSALRRKFGNNAKHMTVDEDMLDPNELEQIAKVGEWVLPYTHLKYIQMRCIIVQRRYI